MAPVGPRLAGRKSVGAGQMVLPRGDSPADGAMPVGPSRGLEGRCNLAIRGKFRLLTLRCPGDCFRVYDRRT